MISNAAVIIFRSYNSEDGPCYHPVIATISLGCYTVLDMYHKLNNKDRITSLDSEFSLLLEPNSCLILSGEYYTDYLHGIKESEHDDLQSKILNLNDNTMQSQRQRDSTRISLTFRTHKKVISKKFFKIK